MLLSKGSVWLIVILGVFSDAYKFAEWSFDNHTGTTIIPEYPKLENYYADVSPLGNDMNIVLPRGKVERAVFVDKKSFNLASDLQSTCIRDPDQCGSGMMFTFYLKIVSWNNASDPVIFRTMPADKSKPGIYFGKKDNGKDDKLIFYFLGTSGKRVTNEFSLDKAWNKWGKITTKLDDKGISTLVNDAKPSSQLIGIVSGTIDPTAIPTLGNFTVGADNGPTFYLDEFSIDYFPTTGQESTTSKQAATTSQQSLTSPITNETSSPSIITSTQNRTPQDDTTHSPLLTSIGEIQTTPGRDTYDITNIWIPILIAMICVGLIIFLVIICRQRRRRRGANISSTNGTALERRNGDYARTSVVEPYHDDASNAETDDNQTDNEGQQKSLLRIP